MLQHIRYLALLLALGLVAPWGLAQPGRLDPSFGDGGVVLLDTTSVESAALDSNGSLVTWGLSWSGTAPSTDRIPTLQRLLADGSLDATFGDGGTVAMEPIPCGFCGTFPTVVAVLSSDAIVAADYSVNDVGGINGRWRFVHPNGTPVTTVSVGRATWAIAVRPDGRYIDIGTDGGFAAGFCSIRQYLPDGTLDPTFGEGGVIALTPESSCWGGALLGDGRLTVWLNDDAGGVVARFLEDGSLDPAYGVGGTARVEPVRAGAVDADGTVLLGRRASTYPTLVRLAPNGTLDATFGDGGIAALESLGDGRVENVAFLPDGDTAVTVSLDNHANSRVLTIRVMADGTMDLSFGEGGLASVDLGFGSVGRSLIVDAEGRIIVAGDNQVGDSIEPQGFVFRLLNEGSVASEPSAQPERLALSAPVPNPASAQATLTYTLAAPTSVRLAVYDVLGREVAVLAEGTRPAGPHVATLDASRLAPGLYVARLTVGGESASQRLTVVR